MSEIVVLLKLTNYDDPSKSLSVSALVDTGARYITLPMAWREQLGRFRREREVRAQMADGSVREGLVCEAIEAQIADFDPIVSEVLFLDMEPEPDGEYEPLIGYISLEQAALAVDMRNHRLVAVPYVEVK